MFGCLDVHNGTEKSGGKEWGGSLLISFMLSVIVHYSLSLSLLRVKRVHDQKSVLSFFFSFSYLTNRSGGDFFTIDLLFLYHLHHVNRWPPQSVLAFFFFFVFFIRHLLMLRSHFTFSIWLVITCVHLQRFLPTVFLSNS